MVDFVKVCPNCKSSNIIQKIPQMVSSWICMNCGNINFTPIEIMKKNLE
jgi:transposase-like protein